MSEYLHPSIRRKNIRLICQKLSEDSLVKSYKREGTAFHIQYATGTRETWNTDPGHKLTIPYDPFKGPDVVVRHNYETNEVDLSKMYVVRYVDWKSANFYSKRLVLQDLLSSFLPVQFTQDELMADLGRLWKTNLWKAHSRHNSLVLYGYYSHNYYPGRKIIEHHMDWNNNLRDAWRNSPMLFFAMKQLLSFKKDITRHSLICTVSNLRDKRRANYKFVCPNFYRLVFKRFELRNKIIADPYPGTGCKAIAASMEENVYHHPSDLSALAKFMGAEFPPLNRTQYDCVILDFDWVNPGKERLIAELKQWARRADIKIVYVPQELERILPAPQFRVKVQTKLFQKTHDWVYCYY
jgi:hypothetical protein